MYLELEAEREVRDEGEERVANARLEVLAADVRDADEVARRVDRVAPGSIDRIMFASSGT